MKKERNTSMTTQSVSLETNINYTYDLKKYHAEDENSREEGIRKQFIKGGVYIPQLECTKLQFHQSKLKSEERILNLILQRAWGVNRRMGAEFALEDILSYLKKWKKENKGWQKKARERLSKIETNIQEGKLNGHQKNNA